MHSDPWLQAKFKYWLEYVGGNVGLKWKHSIPPNVEAGDDAGHLDANGTRVFKLTYQGYNAASTIVCMHEGWYPKRVTFKDGNKANLDYANLSATPPVPLKLTPQQLLPNSLLHKLFSVRGNTLVYANTPNIAIDKILPSGYACVRINGHLCQIQNVLFQMVYGRFPPSKLYPLDSNRLNLVLSNWTTVRPIPLTHVSEYPGVRYMKGRKGWVLEANTKGSVYETDIVAFVAYLKDRIMCNKEVPSQFTHVLVNYKPYIESPRPIPFRITLPPFPHHKPSTINLALTRNSLPVGG